MKHPYSARKVREESVLLLIRLVKWLEITFRYTASRVHMNGRGQKRKRRPMNFVADLPIRFPE